jgi:hypothetical protein
LPVASPLSVAEALTRTRCTFTQYADLGYAETDGSLEWDNDYPNPITYTPPDQVTTVPGVVTRQFDNVLNAVCAFTLLDEQLGGVHMC